MKRFQTGTNYELWVGGDGDPQHKVSFGIKMKAGVFGPDMNFVAVLLDGNNIRDLIADLQARLLEKDI